MGIVWSIIYFGVFNVEILGVLIRWLSIGGFFYVNILYDLVVIQFKVKTLLKHIIRYFIKHDEKFIFYILYGRNHWKTIAQQFYA